MIRTEIENSLRQLLDHLEPTIRANYFSECVEHPEGSLFVLNFNLGDESSQWGQKGQFCHYWISWDEPEIAVQPASFGVVVRELHTDWLGSPERIPVVAVVRHSDERITLSGCLMRI
jgi:hypothetical protein